MAIDTSISFKIVKSIAVLSTNPSGWTKEINIVSWSGREPKFDVRDWSPDHAKCGKGLTFTEEEMDTLIDVIWKEKA